MKEIGDSRLTLKQKRIFTAAMIALVLIFTGVIAYFVGKPLLQYIKEPDGFKNFVKEHGIISDIVFIMMIVFQIIIALIPGEPFEIAAGYSFNIFRGCIDCMIGFALGGVIIFLFVKKYGVRIVEVFFPIEKIKNLKFLQNPKRVNTLTFIFFLIPGTPKDLLTYFVGLTDMKLSVWIFITTLARMPSLITSVLAGSALSTHRYGIAAVVLATSLAISGIGLLVYKKITNRQSED